MAQELQKKTSNWQAPPTPKKFSNNAFEVATIERIRVEEESDVDRVYQLGEVLGKGAFGVVREVTNRESGDKHAMKIVPKNKPGSISIQLLEREVEVLKRVNHPNIIQVHAVYETGKKMYILMELCLGGELSVELKKRTYFKEQDAKEVMRRIVEAVVYMHDNDMVHRDLKLENILLATADPEDYSIKVTDFGLANMKGLPGCEDSLMHSKCGTPYYMAPEVLDTRHDYTKMCDVWSLGVILYSLLCGKYPFYSSKTVRLEELIQEGKLTFGEIEWINVSQIAKDLLKNMLCVDTTSRYTARRILDDHWFTGVPKKMMDALSLMKDMAGAEESSNLSTTNIVVSSPSDCFPPTTATLSSPSSTSNVTTPSSSTTRTQTPTKVLSATSQNPSSTSLNKKTAHGTPTKKTSTYTKPCKLRTHSTSSFPTQQSGPGRNLHSTSTVTSPTHKHSVSSSHLGGGPRQRGATYSSGTKSLVLAPPSGAHSVASSNSSSSKGSSTESIHSSNSREKKLTSPNRTTRGQPH